MHFSCLLTFACAGNIDPTLTPPAESVPSFKNWPGQRFSRSRRPASERLPWGTAGVRLIVRPLQWAVVSNNSGVYVYASYTHQIPGGHNTRSKQLFLTSLPAAQEGIPQRMGTSPLRPHAHILYHMCKLATPESLAKPALSPVTGTSLAFHPGSHS